MTYYYKLGKIPHKRHTQFRQPDESLYHEELIGTHGFSGMQSLLYHLHPPTQIQKIVWEQPVAIAYEESTALRPRHLRTKKIKKGGDAIASRVLLMGNADLQISVARPTEPMSYWYRFAHGDEIIFMHHGSGIVESQYGILHYRPGDYLVIPTGVLWRIIPDADIAQRMLVIEAWGHIETPQRYLNQYGQFLESAPYCERDLRPPEQLITHDESGEFEVRVKARNGIKIGRAHV